VLTEKLVLGTHRFSKNHFNFVYFPSGLLPL
jgi:hypothetical protein